METAKYNSPGKVVDVVLIWYNDKKKKGALP